MNKKFAQRFRHAVNGGTPDSLARFPVYLTYQGVDRTPQISGISLHKTSRTRPPQVAIITPMMTAPMNPG